MPADARPCPRCNVPLFEGSLGAASLLGCGSCGGVWLDSAACHALVRGSAVALTALAEQAARHATVAPEQDEAACPVCRQPLTRTRVPPTTVTIDTCAAHGTWFDPSELRVVALAYAHLPGPAQLTPYPGAAGARGAQLLARGETRLSEELVTRLLEGVVESLVSDTSSGGDSGTGFDAGGGGSSW